MNAVNESSLFASRDFAGAFALLQKPLRREEVCRVLREADSG